MSLFEGCIATSSLATNLSTSRIGDDLTRTPAQCIALAFHESRDAAHPLEAFLYLSLVLFETVECCAGVWRYVIKRPRFFDSRTNRWEGSQEPQHLPCHCPSESWRTRSSAPGTNIMFCIPSRAWWSSCHMQPYMLHSAQYWAWMTLCW
jgi:hypothetical protein